MGPRQPGEKKRTRFALAKLLLLAGGSVFAVAGGLGAIWIASLKIPDLSSLQTRIVSQSTKIYDRTGTVLLYDLNQGVRRTIVSDSEISRNIKNATVAIEDSSFYQHHGIKVSAILRAMWADLTHAGYSQGGSTITQQVVKNSLLTDDKSISRKLKEWILALKLERVLDKTAILDIYLNEVPYGGNIYGVEEASETYFGKKASDLDLAESAYLAALPNAPTYYSPYGNHRAELEDRKNLVLERMLENQFIGKSEYEKAKNETVTFLPQEDTGIKAPHFVMFIREYLEKKYGSEVVDQGGLKVITTLDWNLQQKAEALVKQYALQNEKTFNASNAAAVAIDPKTGQILAMVGSRDYFDKNIDGNFNVALAHRQPGSTFKPFVYSEAFLKGYTPDTIAFDLPIEFSTDCNPDGTPITPGDEAKCYKPEDFDGKYRGPMTLRDALAQSINIPAIEMLYLAGIPDSLALAKSFGITTLGDPNQYGLTLVLGGGEVSLLDMTSAYSVFANDGVRNPYQAILRITDKAGQTLESYQPSPTTVIPPNIARTISSILDDNAARAPEFGLDSALYFPGQDVAVKTGTTNDYRDAWVIGYTPEVAVGSWAGNNDNSPMQKKIAGFILAPLWHAVMAEALKDYPSTPFPKPDPIDETKLKPVMAGFWQGGVPYFIDKISGDLATDYTPAEDRIEKVVTNVHSILYWVDKNDPLGPAPADPATDPQFPYWEYAVQKWVAQNHIQNEPLSVIPTEKDPVHTPENAPIVRITNPAPTISYPKREKIVVTLSASGRYPLAKVDFFVNNEYLGSSSSYPFSFAFVPGDLDNVSGANVIRAAAYDSVGNRSDATANFTVSE